MKNTKTLTIAEQAFAYHVNGYSVMPCKRDKKPALSTWKKYQTTHPTDDEVIKWFKNGFDRTIGIITGAISQISVVDIDNKNGNAEEMLTKFPETYTVLTGNKGFHLYYKYQEGLSISANAYTQFPNVDIRSDGGYIIGAGSVTDYDGKGGEYTVIKNIPLAPFPVDLFPKTKPRKTLTEKLTATKGSRNDNLASFVGQLLQAEQNEDKWITDVLPAVQRANKSYMPQLPDHEVLTVFNSIAKKEKERRQNLALSPIGQVPNITTTKSGAPHNNMSNVIAILDAHSDFKNKIRYNTFRQEIEIDGEPIEDKDIIKLQRILQTKFGLFNISKDAVLSALVHCSYENSYDEAQDWLKDLVWDGTPRLFSWLSVTTGVPDDAYHRGIGTQWFMGIINRIMKPGCIWDYMLVLVGAQGLGKTSLFRIIGGKWYKSYTGAVDNKDFYLALRGAIIIDLDEGATLYRSEAIKIKSIITDTHDEFRAPYDRLMKKFPRRFVFSMSTNDPEPFRDVTGNRRYWVLDLPEQMVNFKWLEDNRDQLFAEAYHYFKENIETPEVPIDEAKEKQEAHLPDDTWTDLVVDEVRKSADYCEGDENYSTSIQEIYLKIFPDEKGLVRLDKRIEMRIGNILRHHLGMDKRRVMIDGVQKNRYFIVEKKLKELQKHHAQRSVSALDKEFPTEEVGQEKIPF